MDVISGSDVILAKAWTVDVILVTPLAVDVILIIVQLTMDVISGSDVISDFRCDIGSFFSKSHPFSILVVKSHPGHSQCY